MHVAKFFLPLLTFQHNEIKHIFVTRFSLTYCYFKRGFHFLSGDSGEAERCGLYSKAQLDKNNISLTY